MRQLLAVAGVLATAVLAVGCGTEVHHTFQKPNIIFVLTDDQFPGTENGMPNLKSDATLENTYIFFSSDNGFHMGQHRFNQGKETAYEEDIAVPMIVRGPGVPADATRQQLVLNQDLAPTFADIADASVPNFVDGRSFLSVLGDNPPDAWRTGFLVQARVTEKRLQLITPMPTNIALRTARYEYIDYPRGKDELYDMDRDPYQIDSIQASAPTDVLAQIRAQLKLLEGCGGDECRAAEGP